MVLEQISMLNARSKEQLTFAFHTQLYTEGGCTCKELPVLKSEKAMPKGEVQIILTITYTICHV